MSRGVEVVAADGPSVVNYDNGIKKIFRQKVTNYFDSKLTFS